MNAGENDIKIEIRNLTMAFGSFVVMRDISAKIKRAEIFIIMGGSGCGKSTLLRHMIGLKTPAQGDIFYDGEPFWQSSDEEKQKRLRSFGVLFQSGALWSSMTLIENVSLPLGEYTDLSPPEIDDIARLKLALVGLKGFEDEPSAGLDPISSRNLDQLMLELRDSLGATFVVVTHELQSIFAIGDNSVFLDTNTRTMRAQGNPRELLKNSTDPDVREFLTRGGSVAAKPAAKTTAEAKFPSTH
jgi:phospholipid/cholesterol/gamma-HCH transport system ATP-binding protein